MGVTTPTPLVMTSDIEGLRIAIDTFAPPS